MCKKEQNKSLQDEITSLKRQLAGSKGRNTQLVRENIDMRKELDDSINGFKKLVSGLESQVTKLSNKNAELKKEVSEKEEVLTTYRHNITWFNNLPWYRKMFVKL